jgi:uncharacterized protein YcnI
MAGRVARAALTFATAGLLIGALATAASAHVKVTPEVAARGATVELTFTMPNERDDASTTSLTVELPPEYPFATVDVPDHPGWKSTVRTTPLAKPMEVDGKTVTEVVSQVTWTADDTHKLSDDARVDFLITVGPLPDADELVFKALQTYDSGEVVRWIQLPDPSNAEPERPAPVVKLMGKGGGSAKEADDGKNVKAAFVGGGVAVILLAGGALAVVAFRRKATR